MQDKKAAKALRTEMKEADTNGDGMISFIEFLGYFQKMARYRADLARTQRLESYGRPRDLPPSMCHHYYFVVIGLLYKASRRLPATPAEAKALPRERGHRLLCPRVCVSHAHMWSCPVTA